MEQKRYLELNLPIYLQHDIDALQLALCNDSKKLSLDCYICEVQGSINCAYVDDEISKEQCDYLFKKYVYPEK